MNKRTKLYARVKIALLVMLAFAVCGCRNKPSAVSATDPKSPQAKIDPCRLLTSEEVAAASGDKVEVTPEPKDNACSYDLLAAPNGNTRAAIVVVVIPPDSPHYAKFGLSSDQRTQATPLSGLGDRAVLFTNKATPDGGAKAIQIMKGSTFIAVGVSASTPAVSTDIVKSLAAKAVSRVP